MDYAGVVYNSYSNQISNGGGGETGATGPTGPPGPPGSNTPPAVLPYQVRSLKRKVYKGYRLEIIPKHNTQESYDEVVTPFLDLDDIGVEIQIYQPQITRVWLDLKPEFQDQAKEIDDHNKNVVFYNSLISKIFDTIHSILDDNLNTSTSDIMKTVQSDVDECGVELRVDLQSAVYDMIDKLRDHNRNENTTYDDDNDNDYDDYAVHSGIFMKYSKYIPQEWHDYRDDVDFNDFTKLCVKCHEHTQTYRLIDDFLKSM
ncbi:Hypothetical protein HVR_LOCUS843 [uncultured virus]|nr:Hypothetical protein HVR_LOCUS843 [uncultured virus]